jgi:hypothetical protein
MISWFSSLWKNLFRRKQLDKDLDEELDAYAELASAEKVLAGMSPVEARAHTRCEMGGEERIQQGVRDIRAGVSLERLFQDSRYGIRTCKESRLLSGRRRNARSRHWRKHRHF